MIALRIFKNLQKITWPKRYNKYFRRYAYPDLNIISHMHALDIMWHPLNEYNCYESNETIKYKI